MNIEIIKPKSNVLQKYIECFYILTHTKKTGKTTYFTFPSIFSILSVTENADVEYTDTYIRSKPSLDHTFDSGISANFTNPLLIQYEGYSREITTYFKPLGLSAFLEKPLQHYCGDYNEQFEPFQEYASTMQAILKMTENEPKKAMLVLENYWLSKLKKELHFKLETAIKTIIADPNKTIAAIAKENNVSHKTLIAHFKKHMCKTPTEFRKIVRFRKSLDNKKENNLTELSYLANYFDQAHMIKDFKKLTGYNPKDFFKNISSIDGKINWIFTER